MTYIQYMMHNKELLLNHKVPFSYPKSVQDVSYPHVGIEREDFIPISAFPLICNEWVNPLAEYIGDKKCIEVMAGTGMLSKALQNFGVSITATDSFMWEHTHWFPKDSELWTDIEKIDCCEAIRKYATVDFVVCSWPYMDDNCYECLMTMREVNPSCKMIYIGELDGGCTASNKFFEAADWVEDEEFDHSVYKFMSWRGIHDRICLAK